MQSYRQIRVHIYPGRSQTLIAVVASTHANGSRRDVLVHRAAVDLVDTHTVAALLRAAADECHDAADRLM
jgi:hypothetical protein